MVSPTQWTWVWANSRRQWGQGSLACCSPWGRKESDKTWQLNSKHCQALGTTQNVSLRDVRTTAILVNPDQSSMPGVIVEGWKVGQGRGEGMKEDTAQRYILKGRKTSHEAMPLPYEIINPISFQKKGNYSHLGQSQKESQKSEIWADSESCFV